MKFLNIVAPSLILILAQSCSSSGKTKSSEEKTSKSYYSRFFTPVIDGNLNEWGESLSYDNTTKCIYSIANDESALYIGIKAVDRFQQMKIIQGGMEIWLNEKGKKNKSIGVKFPIGGVTQSMPVNRNQVQDSKQMRLQLKLEMQTMELTGFREGVNGVQSIFSNAQVKPVIQWDNKEDLIYELSIPFTSLNETIIANLNNISIGIFIKGMKMPESPGGGMPAGGPPGGGGPSGGMPPPGGGNSMSDRGQMQDISKDNFFWTKYTIAKK